MAKGNYSVRYNPERLREMIKEGKTAQEITKEFKISPYTLREHLVMLQNEDNKIYVINGLFDYSQAEQSKVNKEGIVFSKDMFKQTGFTPGDAFEMEIEDDRIILKKIRKA